MTARRHRCWARFSISASRCSALVQFGFTLGSYGIGIWMPLILREEGLGDIGDRRRCSSFLTPSRSWECSAWAWLADRTGNKVGNLTLACLLAAAGFGLYYFWTGSLDAARS